MATRSDILAWRIPWTEEPAGYSPWGRKHQISTEELKDHQLKLHFRQTCKATLKFHDTSSVSTNRKRYKPIFLRRKCYLLYYPAGKQKTFLHPVRDQPVRDYSSPANEKRPYFDLLASSSRLTGYYRTASFSFSLLVLC